MSKTIYYFTSTGNSLQAALDIAEGLGETEVVSVAKAGINISCDSDVVGFIFPSFAWGMPNMVHKFIESGNFRKDAYFFTVVTCGSSMGGSAVAVDDLLHSKGAKLSYAASVRMVSNYLPMYNVNTKTIDEVLAKANTTLSGIIADLKDRKSHKIKQGLSFIINPIHEKMTIAWKNADKDYNVSDSCNGCGLCASVCPAKNIGITDGKPVFNHNCEHCIACIHWCPQKAINYKDKTQNRDRYHHPKVKVSQLP